MHTKVIKLLSVCVGQVNQVTITASPELTSFVKSTANNGVMASKDGLSGDTLATGRKMGIRNHAVYAIPNDTFDFWKTELSRPGLRFGGLGENIVIDCPDENTVSIGDRIEIGKAELTVIQPRIPCYKLAHFLGMPRDFPYRFLKSGRTGFYCAVTRPGEIKRGDGGRWIAADGPRISISKFIELTQFSSERAAIAELLDNQHIIEKWKELIRLRLEQLEKTRRKPEGDGWQEVRCERIDDEGNNIKSFHLKAAAGFLGSAKGGQFLTLRRTIDDRTVIRNYSISAPLGSHAAAPGCIRVSVKLDHAPPAPAGQMSSALHTDVSPGDILSVRPPQGQFTLPKSTGHGKILLASGGIGITPMLGMLWQAVIENRSEEILLVHTHRAEHSFPFEQELAGLVERLPNLRIELFNTGAHVVNSNGQALREGRPDWDSLLSTFGTEGLVYVCGPGTLIEAARETTSAQGRDDSALICESFGTLPATKSGTDARVAFARSGQVAMWTPRDGSLLDLVIGNGIDVKYSCRSGICGTCEIPLLAGKISYPQGFSAETVTSNQILLCSAVPDGDIVIDI